ncbi:MAG: hypothetical protein Kow0010_01130 [Dehalococcoidia bacterium]
MAAIVWLDFEGAVVGDGLTAAFFEAFAPSIWAGVRDAPGRGEMTREQALIAAMGAVEAPEDAMRAWVRDHARVAPDLYDLTDWAHWHGWLPIVVSTAPDLLVDTVLDDLGLDRITRHCPRAQFHYRWRLTYFSPRGVEIEDRFAVAYAAAFRRAGDFVAYVGADPAGSEAAQLAQVTFARDGLLHALGGPDGRIREWTSLRDVKDALDREGEAWLATFSTAATER